jgi:HAE1 family hydrophobic/amphiphilic exporter-1
MGVTASQIENAFHDGYGPRWVSTIYAPVNEYKVLLELAPGQAARPRHDRTTGAAARREIEARHRC